MSDEPSDDGGLPVLSSRQQGLSLQKNSLVKRGLELVTTSVERLTIARTELENARRRLDEAKRASRNPVTWEVFVRHLRDTYRHGLLAMASFLQMDPSEGSVEFAKRLVQQSKGFGEKLPDYVASAEHFVAMIDFDREKARHDWERFDNSEISMTVFAHSNLESFISGVARRIEAPMVGTAVNVVMPQMGEEITEGTIVRWFKTVGEAIDLDEALFEISTEKVDAEIPSPAGGSLAEIFVNEGETVPVNKVVAIIHTH